MNDRRIGKKIDGITTERYVYDGQNIALVFDGSGNQTHRYLYGTGVDTVLADERGGSVVWALADNQGTIRDLVDDTGAIVNHINYDSFGQVVSQTSPSVEFRFGYTGREQDGETGLDYYRARYYDPAVGRFISEDPLGFRAGDSNLSRYVGNSPTNFTDPSGNIAVLIIGGGVIVSYVIGQALAPQPAQTPTTPCDIDHTDNSVNQALIEIATGQIINIGTPLVRGGINYAAPRLGNALSRGLDRLNPPGLIPVPVGGGFGEAGSQFPGLSNGFGRGLGQSTNVGLGTGAGGLSPNVLQSTTGGTGANYDPVNGQGVYVLKDESGAVKYIGRGDAPNRVEVHANTPGKDDLKSRILYDNNLPKSEAKGLEQALVDLYGGSKTQNPNTPLLNKIRSYSPDNPNAQTYQNSVNDEFLNEAVRRINEP